MDTSDPTAGRPLYFFLSYARVDNEDGPFLSQFFTDLRQEVRTRCGHPSLDEVGFLDTTSIQPGDAWSDELAAALARCRTFVAICSRSFFASEYCGREWRVFDERLRRWAATGATRPPALLPVVWTPLLPPPPILSRLQYNHEDLGKGYAKFGLRYLLQLNRNHDEYQEFLVALAERIIHLAEESPLPPMAEVPSFHSVLNAFAPSDDTRYVPAPAGSSWPPRSDFPPGVEGVSVARQQLSPGPDQGSPPEAEPRPGPELWLSQGRKPNPRPKHDPEPRTPAAPTAPETTGTTTTTTTTTATRPTAPEPASTARLERGRAASPDGTGSSTSLPAASTVLAAPTEHGSGPKRVTFVLAVTSASELAGLRRQLDYYGSQFDEWTPYHPRFRQQVCIAAQSVAASQEMVSSVVKLHAGIAQLLDTSRARNEVVIFIVDLWTATLEPFRSALIEYDQRNEPTTGVLVPWNPDDAETTENAVELTEALEQILRNNVIRQDKLFRMDVRSHDEFGKALVQVLVDSQARIFASQSSFRRRESPPRRRPFLDGP